VYLEMLDNMTQESNGGDNREQFDVKYDRSLETGHQHYFDSFQSSFVTNGCGEFCSSK
jgi:hypothetical protein